MIVRVNTCAVTGLAHNARPSFIHPWFSPSMFARTLFTTVLAAFTLPVLADTVWLKNGDRLTGTIKFYDGSKLLLETEYGGAIALDWKQIATLESDQELLIKESAVVGERAKALYPAEAGKVTLANGDQPKTVELASIKQMQKPKPMVEDLLLKGNVDASLELKQAERDTENYDIALKNQARHGLWRHNTTAAYKRKLQDDVVSSDNWSTEYALDRFIDEHWFWQGRFEYKRDYIEEVSRQRSLGSGPGYQFWDDQLGAFSLAGLVNRTDYSFSNGDQANFYAVSMKWDYNRYLLGRSVELYSVGELGKPLSSVAEYALDAEAGLRYKLTDWASLNMKMKKDLISGGENELDETQYSLGLGVGW